MAKSLSNYFFEIHSGLPREGPGSDESTLKALRCLSYLPPNPIIADIGCGPGRASLLLAKETGGHVKAIDLHRPFLDQLKKDASSQGIDDRITIIQGDMNALPLAKEEVGVIWSEGSIYLMGFEKGLSVWRHFLKEGGYLVVSHLSWLTPSPSKDAADFWNVDFPEIASVDKNLAILERLGFDNIDQFISPETDWWNEYYQPMEKSIADVKAKYPHEPLAQKAAQSSQAEIDLWKRHNKEYSYVFYIARKTSSI